MFTSEIKSEEFQKVICNESTITNAPDTQLV